MEGFGYIKRADKDRLRKIFLKYATVERNGEKHITNEDFVRKYLGLFNDDDYNKESVQLIAGIVDTDKDGFISFSEFQAFEGVLSLPNALYKTAFQLFDTNGNGLIGFDEFADVIHKTTLHKNLPFDMNSRFVSLYFGKDKKRQVTYPEFSQFLNDFHEEYGVEAFEKYDKDGTGFISTGDLRNIMLSVKNHLLAKELKAKFKNVTESSFRHGDLQISFPYYMAFISLLNKMELIKRVCLDASKGSPSKKVTKEEFVHSAQMMSQITWLEVDVLFMLSETLHHSDGQSIVYNDLNSMTPERYKVNKPVTIVEDRTIYVQFLETLYRFTLASIAGAFGAAAVYPIDLVKTRMQNQRKKDGKLVYKHSWDCFKQVIQKEGVIGLYRGLLPQLIGVAPEKAIKLSMNDFMRGKVKDSNGNISIYGEAFAGAFAGMCQVVFTNPLEIVKIRLQVAGEVAGAPKVLAMSVVKELGLFGLYKGARPCMMRDMTFSAIYFPSYTHFKAKLADENGYNHPLTLLAAGAFAGIPAASLVTPLDVIKTRIQVTPRPGQTTYNGIIDTVKKIYALEGFQAFWKGTVARVLRSSPQFGVTLLTYEVLQRTFYVDFGATPPVPISKATLPIVPKKPHHIGGYDVAIPVFTGLQTKFGISLPRFSYDTRKPAQ